MNAVAAKYFWNVIVAGLVSPRIADFDELHTQLFGEDIDMPCVIEEKLNEYFCTHDQIHLVGAAIDAVRYFRLTCEIPEKHLILVAFLLKKKIISRAEACKYSQIDRSNFPLMSEDARNLVRLAEVVAEEELIGVRAVDYDNFFESHLFGFSEKNQSEQQSEGSRGQV